MTSLSGKRIAILGNVGPGSYPYATENEYVEAYRAHGVHVDEFSEKDPTGWTDLISRVSGGSQYDFVQWTSTPQYRQNAGDAFQWELIAACRRAGVPLIGVHLDKFWDIPERVSWLQRQPYFKGCDLMLTADGGDYDWAQFDIRHRWLLPGVSQRFCWMLNVPEEEFVADVAFVGSWQGGYHRNSRHRHELTKRLQRDFKATMFPIPGGEAIRGMNLTRLYQGVKVVVGDSFFSASHGHPPPPRYGSDRTPETLGRGGILLHTHIEGWNGDSDPFACPSSFNWAAWDWDALGDQIHYALSMSNDERMERRNAGITHVLANHTYEKRVEQIFAMLETEGLT